MIHNIKGKEWRAHLLKLDAMESLYGIWKYRNDISYNNSVDNTKIVENSFDMIVYRG